MIFLYTIRDLPSDFSLEELEVLGENILTEKN